VFGRRTILAPSNHAKGGDGMRLSRVSTGVRWLTVAASLLWAVPLAGQQSGTVTGTVTLDGSGVFGAQVVLMSLSSGAQFGGLTNDAGRFQVIGVRPGSYEVSVQMIGFVAPVQRIDVEVEGTTVVDFQLAVEAVTLGGIEVFANRAEERRTPVAFTDVDKTQLQQQLGSRDLPLVMATTPSVYSTVSGGGAGDARINVRGFSQRNTAVMINGVPVNDMENGWVYWSNWDGLGDAATSIQLQRGLSAVNLATPSIGGTLNVITDPSAQDPGYMLKQEFGTANFLKTTLTASTGRIGRFALTASGVKKQGDGLIDGTWTDAWSYYLASSFDVSERNRLELYAVGAPQRHGQNLYKLNLATLNRDFALEQGDYDRAALDKFTNEAGRLWSPNVGGVDPSYIGRQFASSGPGNGTFSRFDRSFINERENYFHKPQINLNWYSFLADGLTLSTVAYYSGGEGGGTGTYGSLRWDYRYTQRYPDWNGTIERNAGNDGALSSGILRNSVNNQWTIGGIAKLQKEFDSGLTAEIGIDARTAEIEHYREVRDLLGGDAYRDCFTSDGVETCSSAFWTDAEKDRGLGDKINYHNENSVNWVGMHLQAERSNLNGSYYGMVGLSTISYDFTDFFKRGSGSDFLRLESGSLWGYQVKGGAVRNLTSEWSVYGNAGWVSKVPIFDGVIDDNAATKNPDPKNETFLSFEAGTRFRSLDRRWSLDGNLYFTQWNDRTRNQFVRNLLGDNQDGLVNLLGVDARHMGVELEAAFQPTNWLRFDGAASFGDWKYTNDVEGTYRPDDRLGETLEFNFYLDGLYVGDAPQVQLAYAASVFPAGGLYVQAVGKTFAKHYSEYDPFDRTDASDTGIQPWQPPGYTVFDLHMAYQLGDSPGIFGGNVKLFLNVFNLFDEIYVQDAVDNSAFNGYDDDHDADDAEVFLGFPRSFNFGFQISR
jgi:iron complex outermembrane receptor protein